MKLQSNLHPDWRATIAADVSTLSELLAEHRREVAAIHELRKTASDLERIIAQLEEAAAAGTDAEAAIQLAGRREQRRLLAANIEGREQALPRQLFERLRSATNTALTHHRVTCREMIEPHVAQLTKLLTPHFTSEGFARQAAIQFPSSKHLMRLHSENLGVTINDFPSAVNEAQIALGKAEDILAGRDIYPDFAEVIEAENQRNQFHRDREARITEQSVAAMQMG